MVHCVYAKSHEKFAGKALKLRMGHDSRISPRFAVIKKSVERRCNG